MERWLGQVIWAGVVVFSASLFGDSMMAGTWVFRDGGVWYELGFWARASAYAWAAAEAGRYYRTMRRRLKFVLADPVVTDRFRYREVRFASSKRRRDTHVNAGSVQQNPVFPDQP